MIFNREREREREVNNELSYKIKLRKQRFFKHRMFSGKSDEFFDLMFRDSIDNFLEFTDSNLTPVEIKNIVKIQKPLGFDFDIFRIDSTDWINLFKE
jgi:hypothetical protein